jgi:toxin secretion/phage lysis holin
MSDEFVVFIKLAIATFISYIASFLDMYGIVIAVAIGSMAFDWFTALGAAVYNKEVSSEKGHKGFVKKMMLITLIFLGCFLDWAVPEIIKLSPYAVSIPSIPLGIAAAIYVFINEMISIGENFKKVNIKLPTAFNKVLRIFK